MAIVLIIKMPDNKIIELPILSKTTIGRSSSNDLKIDDSKVSGKHCAFDINPKGQLVFTDLGSSNGSYVNNSIVSKEIIKINDIVRIGSTFIKIDYTKLSTKEKALVGFSSHSNKEDKSLPVLKKGSQVTTEQNTVQKKISLSLDKDSLPSKNNAEIKGVAGRKENLLDQEESGHTKFLEIEKKKKL